MGQDSWAPLVQRFVDEHYGSLRGLVRTHVIDQHLRWHLPPPPAAIVDVGSGAGTQSLPLAIDGYSVTMVDPSAAMLDKARAKLRNQTEDVIDRVDLVEATGVEAPAALDGRRFTGVLCHGVLMYLDDPEPTISALAELAADGAILSIVAKSVRALAVRPALGGAWKEALAAFDSSRHINGLGLDSRGDDVDDLSIILASRDIQPVVWYGVRLFTDGWTQESPTDDLDDVLAVELEASRRDPYRQLSRLFHLVGRKTADGLGQPDRSP